MSGKRIGRLIVGVLLLGMVAGCAGLPTGGAAALPAGFRLQLPPVYLQYVETADGSAEPSVAGLGASLIEGLFGINLGAVKIPAFYVAWLKASDLQHLEIVTGAEGVLAYANGKPTPYLAWSEESLGLAANVASAFGVAGVETVTPYLPWLTRIGLDIVVQMPLAKGATVIPYRSATAGLMTTTAAPELENPAGEIKLEISYDADGNPTILGIPGSALAPILGSVPGKLDPGMIANLSNAGVKSLQVKTRGDGLFIFVNDVALPNLAWDKDHLTNALDLYAEMNAASWSANQGLVTMIRDLVLQTTNIDLQLTVNFP